MCHKLHSYNFYGEKIHLLTYLLAQHRKENGNHSIKIYSIAALRSTQRAMALVYVVAMVHSSNKIRN